MQLLPHLHLHHRVVRELLVQRGATGIAASSAAASVEGWQRRRRTQQALSWPSLTSEKGGLIPPFIARDVNPVLLFSRQVPFQAYPYCLLTRVLLPPASGSCVGLALGRAP